MSVTGMTANISAAQRGASNVRHFLVDSQRQTLSSDTFIRAQTKTYDVFIQRLLSEVF